MVELVNVRVAEECGDEREVGCDGGGGVSGGVGNRCSGDAAPEAAVAAIALAVTAVAVRAAAAMAAEMRTRR